MEQVRPSGIPQDVFERKEALPLLYQPAVLILGVIGAGCVVGMILLSVFAQPVSDGLIAIGSVAVGAIANMVAQESRSNGN